MARRIAFAVLALITGLLAVVAVPLGLLTAAQDRRDFRVEAGADASALANVAEERIDDGHGTALNRSVASLESQGDRVAVYDAAGRWVAGTRTRPAAAARITVQPPVSAPHSYWARDWIVATTPVVPDSGTGSIGTVELSRSTEPLDHRVLILWGLIGGVSAAGLVAAGIVAIGLARWLSRPITTLASAARELGDGALDTRVRVGAGPPEARRLSMAFNMMAARIESLVQGHQTLMADVSHQVRTPLAALRLRLDLLSQDADEVTAAELAGAQEEIARLARLTNGLLAVARAENTTAPPARVDVAAVARDRVAAWRPAAEERGVALTVTAPRPAGAELGAGHLEQILDNLLANALDALETGGAISVTAGAAGEWARVTVSDNGRGMSGPQQRAAFHRFASGTAGGTGLGLAIVDRLAVANGGSASLSDTPGGGLTVTIELPLRTSAAAGKPASSRRPVSSGTSPSPRDPGDLN
jgi:signal transduction histidine kinase